MSFLLASLIGAGLTAASTIGGSLISSSATKKANAQNLALQQKTWEREDNAVQRRVHDLEAAGLSKTLAAGDAAASSSPISVKSADFGSGVSGAGSALGQGLVQAIQLKNELATSAMERERLAAEANKANAEADYTRQSRTDYTTAQTDLLFLQKAEKEAEKAHDYPSLKYIQSQIAEKRKAIQVMDVGIDKSKYELANLRYDTNLSKSLGLYSSGAKSTYGKIASDILLNNQYEHEKSLQNADKLLKWLRGIF